MAIESVPASKAVPAAEIIALPNAAISPVQNPPPKRGAPPKGVIPQSKVRRARALRRQSAEELIEEIEQTVLAPEFASSAAGTSPSNVIDMAARASTREVAFRKRVDETTKSLHYAMRAVQTAIFLARRDWQLPDLE